MGGADASIARGAADEPGRILDTCDPCADLGAGRCDRAQTGRVGILGMLFSIVLGLGAA
jgi:hypothetical protein